MTQQQVLITGGDGFIGLHIARRILSSSTTPVLLWMRAENQDAFKLKGQELCHTLCDEPGRATFAWGDLLNEEPFARIDPNSITAIIHSAAVTRFNVDQETADRVNIQGTLKILKFARLCPNLKSLCLLSTVYSAGLHSGNILEEAFDDSAGFSNYYEWSKFHSERLLMNEYSDLPWKIFRVATVIADNDNGTVTQQNAVHNTLKLIYYGLLSLIPGKSETPLYFVTADFVSRAIVSLLYSDPGSIFHVCHRKEESLTLGRFLDVVFKQFEKNEDFRRRRVLRPLYSDAPSFQLLTDTVSKFSGEIVSQAVSSVAPFAMQLYVSKDIHNARLAKSFPAYQAPDPERLLQNVCEYLVETRWGRVKEEDRK